MADKIARASSTPAKKEEGKKKLTTLNGRAKPAGGEAEGSDIKSPGPAENGQGLSPPDTPSLPVTKPGRGRGAAEQEPTATPSLPSDPPRGSGETGIAAGPAADGGGSGRHPQPAPEAPQPLVAPRPPPGFGAPVASKAKVMPPPGFAHLSQEGGGRFASPLGSMGSETSSPAQPYASRFHSEQGAGPSHNIWGSSNSLDNSGVYPRQVHNFPVGSEAPHPAPRARSRFQFANEQTSPPHPSGQTLPPAHGHLQHYPFSQLSHPPPDYRVFGSVDAYQNGHTAGYQAYSPGPIYPSDSGQAHMDLGQHSRVEEGEPLPAGLALLRRLQQQAKGGSGPGGGSKRGVSNPHASPSQPQQHAIFQDPAILSATPSTEYGLPERSWDAAPAGGPKAAAPTPDPSPPPKTPNRRGRKGKGTG